MYLDYFCLYLVRQVDKRAKLTLVFLSHHPVCHRLHQNAKQSDPGHLSNLFYIRCGHFDEKKSGGTPNGGRVSRQSLKVRGWLPPENILSRHFEKYLQDMDLKLTEHVKNTISLLYKQKTWWNSDIWNFLAKKSILAHISLKIDIFRSAMLYYVIVTLCVDRFSWFWYQRKEETLPYIMVPNNYTLGVPISNSQGVVTIPRRKTC